MNKKVNFAAIIIFVIVLVLVGAGLVIFNSKNDELIRVSRSVSILP